jgi:inorganic pyrophosphatase
MQNIKFSDKFPSVVPIFIEVAKNSNAKYEYNFDAQMLELDRVIHSSNVYPHAYGFVPHTLCDDGDAMDALILCSADIMPGTLVHGRVVGILVMEDEKGFDEKLLCVVNNDPFYDDVHSFKDVNKKICDQIWHFFETYKTLELHKWVKVHGWKDEIYAKKLLQEKKLQM